MKSKLSFILGFAIALAACGGGAAIVSNSLPVSTPAPSAPSIRYSQQSSAGNAGYGFSASNSKVTLSGLNLSPLARMGMFLFAAGGGGGSSVSLAGSYNGYVALAGAGSVGAPSNAPASGGWLPAYGFGSNSILVANYNEIPANYYGTSATGAINSTVYGSPKLGVPVVGSGNITNLVVIADSAGGSQSDSGTVQILDNGAELSGVTCSLGSNQRCEVAGLTVPVSDGDVLQAAVKIYQADTYQRIDVIATKQ